MVKEKLKTRKRSLRVIGYSWYVKLEPADIIDWELCEDSFVEVWDWDGRKRPLRKIGCSWYVKLEPADVSDWELTRKSKVEVWGGDWKSMRESIVRGEQ